MTTLQIAAANLLKALEGENEAATLAAFDAYAQAERQAFPREYARMMRGSGMHNR